MANTLYSPLSGRYSSVTAIILNLILILCTLKHTPKLMKDYARVIRAHSLFEIILDIEVFFSLSHPIVLNGRFYVISFSTFSTVSPQLVSVILYSYYVMILNIICVSPVDFYYRYLTVCKEKTLSFCKLFGIFVLIVIANICEGAPLVWFMKEGPSNATIDEKYDLYTRMGWDIDAEFPRFIVAPMKHPYARFSVFSLAVKLILLYGIIIFTVREIRKKACEFQNTNASIKKIHSHIQRVLAIQASVPIIFCVPICLFIAQGIFEFQNITLSDLTSTIGIWYFPLKTLITILVIPPYRRAFLSPISRLFSCQSNEVAAQT